MGSPNDDQQQVYRQNILVVILASIGIAKYEARGIIEPGSQQRTLYDIRRVTALRMPHFNGPFTPKRSHWRAVGEKRCAEHSQPPVKRWKSKCCSH